MPTTTIRLPDELKERIARVAERAGVSTHAFILDAVAERVADEERSQEFIRVADERYAQILASGQTIPWIEMRKFLEDRAAGHQASLPSPKPLGD